MAIIQIVDVTIEDDRAERVRDGRQHVRRGLGVHAGVGDELAGGWARYQR